ncbi:MAG: dienelactone hydrolase family protein [Candidatus Methylomirabilia bacterium]
MRLYLDVRAGGKSFPGVIVIQHGPGVDKFVEDRLEDLARHGYVAAAPDLYHRQPPEGDMMTRIGRLRDAELIRDVDATIDHIRRLEDAQVWDLGIIGFCMGGRVTYLMAGSNPVFKAAGVFYGGNIMKAWGDGPTPFELTQSIQCPVIGFFGMDDTNPSPAESCQNSFAPGSSSLRPVPGTIHWSPALWARWTSTEILTC